MQTLFAYLLFGLRPLQSIKYRKYKDNHCTIIQCTNKSQILVVFKILCFSAEINVAKVHLQHCWPLPVCGCWSAMKFTDVRSELRLVQAVRRLQRLQ